MTFRVPPSHHAAFGEFLLRGFDWFALTVPFQNVIDSQIAIFSYSVEGNSIPPPVVKDPLSARMPPAGESSRRHSGVKGHWRRVRA